MSLIIDINPVPWKILDLVRARILKNRAKKAKKGMDWSKETMKREMSLQPGPLSRRKRDEPSFIPGGQVDVGVGWLHIGYNYTVLPETELYSDSGWSNGLPPNGPISGFTRTTRIFESTVTESASLEFVITVGTGSGETWKQARHSLSFVSTGYSFTEWTYYRWDGFGYPSLLNKFRRISSSSGNSTARLWYQLLPAGPSEIILVVTIAQFSRSGAFYNDGEVPDDPRPRPPGVPNDSTGSPGILAVQSTKQISFLITPSSVTELTHTVPAFIQKRIDSLLALPVYQWPSGISIQSALPQSAIGIHQIGFERASSVVYESIAPDGTFSAVSAQQAKTSYAEYSGIAEIPVLGYERDDPSVASTPTTERGSFGIIPDASVTAPVTTEMLAAGLDDELEQFPGPNAANQPEPVQMVVAYDYHGGSYCRDRLTQLGINL